MPEQRSPRGRGSNGSIRPNKITANANERRRKSSLEQVTILQCRFHARIGPHDLHRFKGALIHTAKVMRPALEAYGCDLALFHGRDDDHPDWREPVHVEADRAMDHADKAPVLNWPPLVLFRQEQGHPVVVGVGPGARALQVLLLLLGRPLLVAGRRMHVQDYSLDRTTWPMGPAPQGMDYLLHAYAFIKVKKTDDQDQGPNEWELYRSLRTEAERMAFIEDKLVKHIVMLYTELDEPLKTKVRVQVLECRDERTEAQVDGPRDGRVCELRFRTNVYLPPGAALGVGTRLGWGRLDMP